MALPERPNTGKPWTPQEVETVRRLAETNAAPGVIARQLGRSLESVSKLAQKLGISLGENSLTRVTERREARRRDTDDPAPG